jgi:hypothetical protein
MDFKKLLKTMDEITGDNVLTESTEDEFPEMSDVPGEYGKWRKEHGETEYKSKSPVFSKEKEDVAGHASKEHDKERYNKLKDSYEKMKKDSTTSPRKLELTRRQLNVLRSKAGLTEQVDECGEVAGSNMSDINNSYSVSTSYDSMNDRKSISVNASGEAAEELADLLKLGGISSSDDNKEILDDGSSEVEASPSTSYLPVNEAAKYAIRVGDKFVMTYPNGVDKIMLTTDSKSAAGYTDTAKANRDAVIAKDEFGSAKVVPILDEESNLFPKRDDDWANSPNEQMAGWRAVIDNADGPNNPKAMHQNYRGGDNQITVDTEEEKKPKKLHENAKINKVAEGLLNKFHATLTENVDSVYNAILNRIERTDYEIVRKFGIKNVEDKVREIADSIGDVEKVEPADITKWANNVRRELILPSHDDFDTCEKCDGTGVLPDGNYCEACAASGQDSIAMGEPDRYV